MYIEQIFAAIVQYQNVFTANIILKCNLYEKMSIICLRLPCLYLSYKMNRILFTKNLLLIIAIYKIYFKLLNFTM